VPSLGGSREVDPILRGRRGGRLQGRPHSTHLAILSCKRKGEEGKFFSEGKGKKLRSVSFFILLETPVAFLRGRRGEFPASERNRSPTSGLEEGKYSPSFCRGAWGTDLLCRPASTRKRKSERVMLSKAKGLSSIEKESDPFT